MVDQLMAVVKSYDSPRRFFCPPCPRSRRHPGSLVRILVNGRRRNSWWKRQLSCPSLQSSSTPLTFQLVQVVLAVEVFKVLHPGGFRTFPEVKTASGSCLARMVQLLGSDMGWGDFFLLSGWCGFLLVYPLTQWQVEQPRWWLSLGRCHVPVYGCH